MENQAIVPATSENVPAVTSQGPFFKRMLARIDGIGFWLEPEAADRAAHPLPEVIARRPINTGLTLIWLFFGVFGLWAALAPLDSAIIAPGKVILNNNKKTIQHLEGGIVDKILVREGQNVKKGDVLIRLDETAAKARYELVRKQYLVLRAAEARLIAERDDTDKVDFPKDLLEEKEKDENAKQSVDSQARLFETRRDSLKGKISVLNQKIAQIREDISGMKAQMVSSNRQVQLLNQEIASVRTLVQGGNAPRSRLLALERQVADVSGQLGEYRSRMSHSEQSIAEARIEIINSKNDFLNQVMGELKETQTNLSDTEERIRASADTFNRVNILSPLDGTVTGLKFFTVGGVIRPGEPIMDIVPSDDTLIVEARVMPNDIDVVHAGLKANVRLSAYKSRFVHPIEGKVVNVSADRFDDLQRGTAYYTARVEVDARQLADLHTLNNVILYPGMPADVYVVTGTRTMLAYLFSPIRNSFSKSFRED